ncbi:MAG: ATPase, T2SS/T4P/T4SS family, partial [Lentisphaerota bacterium]
MLIGEILVAMGKATGAQIDAALAKQRLLPAPRRLGELLVEEGIIGETDLLHALGRQFEAEVLDHIEPDQLDPAMVSKLPVEWARANCMLPARRAGRIVVLMNDPSRMHAVDDLSLLLGQELLPVLAPERLILKAIEQCYFRKKDTAEDLLKDISAETPSSGPQLSGSDDLLRKADHAPVAQLVNVVLLEAVKARASDIHIEPFEKKIVIRYRVDGLLYEQSSPPKHLEAALISRLKVMARLDIAERRMPQDGAARVRVGEREIDIRVSTIPVAEGERVVLRLLDRDSALLPLTSLGMPEGILARFRQILQEPNGVILVTGPTGSGKTTTLYASLQELDTAHRNVLTIEDPIEYQLPHIGQMQVKPKIGLTFAQGLRHILRQDPDVILVGETRDLETAEIM